MLDEASGPERPAAAGRPTGAAPTGAAPTDAAPTDPGANGAVPRDDGSVHAEKSDTAPHARRVPDGLEVHPGRHRPDPEASRSVLDPAALAFVAELEREFRHARRRLLAARAERQAAIDAGERPTDPPTGPARSTTWRVPPAPADLRDRRVEITGPAEAKMMINALNSGASVFMADLEDALSPTWANVVEGQANIARAVRRTLAYDAPDGRRYRLADRIATLVVRPRGWHLDEPRVRLDGQPVSAALFDAGLFLWHNAAELLERGSGPYLYLPKLQGAAEAALWHDVFAYAEARLGLPGGSIRATVLIEHVLAALEMEEILFALGEHATGLNAGRWDYLFSIIKTFRACGLILPDRSALTMTVPFMRAYTRRLVEVCHRRGAHAIGGMAAYVPSRRDPSANEIAFARVREDKEREAADGFDGTWVAHPDLVPVARAVFDATLGERPNQLERAGEPVTADELLDFTVPGAGVTEAGLRSNVSVALQYLAAWLGGSGAVAINSLMEDAATAEIARSLLWLWRRSGIAVEGAPLTPERYRRIRDEEAAAVGLERLPTGGAAAELLDRLVLAEDFIEFLTLPGLGHLEA
ncbi:MAG TPA: malate synthase A [Candidatus Binatia bacterium]|nr:malate synthase A [Candidatus Binatia bacterium]